MKFLTLKKPFAIALVATAIFCFSTISIFGQEPKMDEFAPAPKVEISKDEQKKLDGESDIKKRTIMSLEMAEFRLKSAESLSDQQKYSELLGELGAYQFFVQDALEFLNKKNDDSKKVRDNFKRLEISLRQQSPRIEGLRRNTPYEFGFHIETLGKLIRELRSKALEPLFGKIVR